ncbi:Ig-like domain-containing protein [Fibrobacterota bacterium]
MADVSYWMKRILLVSFASLLVFSCAELEKKVREKIEGYEPEEEEEVAEFSSKAEELLSQNQGKAVITGMLQEEGTIPVAKGAALPKATNAAGISKAMQNEPVACADATILFYNALSTATNADATENTDENGEYNAVLAEGIYFAFAVKLNRTTLKLITARIDNIVALQDSVVSIPPAVAAEDKTPPTIASIYNAMSPDQSSGVYLLTGVPYTTPKINIVFSEPVDRNSTSGIVVGTMDTSATTGVFALADTISQSGYNQLWNGDNTVLTLAFTSNLDTAVQYGMVIPNSIKDLATNSLEKKAKATFMPVASVGDFKIAEFFPLDGGTLKPNQNPGIIFNRPVDIRTVIDTANVRVSPKILGVWEILGNKAVLGHNTPLEVGQTYTITVGTGVTDIAGGSLAAGRTATFTVEGFSGAAAAGGESGTVALIVEDILDAYMQGDIPRFASHMHPNFRMQEDGHLVSKEEMVESVRGDVADRDRMMAGFPAPVFDNSVAACTLGVLRWKVAALGGGNELWVETEVPPGASRGVYQLDGTEIDQAGIGWNPMMPEFTYNGYIYRYDADFSQFHGPITEDNAENDEFFWMDLLARTSSVVLEPVKIAIDFSYTVDEGVAIAGDTARAIAVMMSSETPDRTNFESDDLCETDTSLSDEMLLNFVLVKEAEEWMVVFMTGSEGGGEIDYDSAFVSFEVFQDIKPIELVSPVESSPGVAAEDAGSAGNSLALEFKRLDDANVGGYIVGIGEDPAFLAGRPPSGGLYFVKQSASGNLSFTLGSNGKPDSGSNASIIMRDVWSLGLPGWERVFFDMPIEELVNWDHGFAGVYYWKVIAITDTSASMFLKSGFSFEKFIGESDFYMSPNYGHFAMLTIPNEREIEKIYMNQGGFMGPMMGPMGFDDMDMDGFPGWLEMEYKTDPNDRTSYPDFQLDTDADGMADFLEFMVDDLDGVYDTLFEKAGDQATIDAQYQTLQDELGLMIVDSDGDGFPDSFEDYMGFNPFDPWHNPGTRARMKAPSGKFFGKLAFAENPGQLFSITFKITKKEILTVKYTAVIFKDTLRDSVGAYFNDAMGEFMFGIRFETGPDAGNTLLLRGNYDQFSSLLQGPMDMIMSPDDKFSTNFGGGPYVGQWAANTTGDNVEGFLNMGMMGPGTMGPGPMMGPMGYRMPPPGVGSHVQFIFDQDDNGGIWLTIIDSIEGDTMEFGNYPHANPEENGHLNFHPDGMGGFNVDGHYNYRSGMFEKEEYNIWGMLFRGPAKGPGQDTESPSWIFDGGYDYHGEECKQYMIDMNGNEDPNMCNMMDFFGAPGQFSAFVPENDTTVFAGMNNFLGILSGWTQADDGMGFGGDRDGDCLPDGMDPMPDDFNNPTWGGECGGMGMGGMPPYLGSPTDLMTFLMMNFAIGYRDTINLKIPGPELMFQTVIDSAHVVVSNEPECGMPGFIRIIPIIGENDDPMMVEQYTKDFDPANMYQHVMQLLVLEEMPGRAAFKKKEPNITGQIITNVLLVEQRGMGGPTCPTGGMAMMDDVDGDCVPGWEDPNDYAFDIPFPGGNCGKFMPSALDGKLDMMGPGKQWQAYEGGFEDFKELVKEYFVIPSAELMNFWVQIQTPNGEMDGTPVGRFMESTGGTIVHPMFPAFHNPTDQWQVAESQNPLREGEIAMVMGPNGPAILVLPVIKTDSVSTEMRPLRGPEHLVWDMVWSVLMTDSVNVHVIDRGQIVSTVKTMLWLMPYSDFVIVQDVLTDDGNSTEMQYAVVLVSPTEMGRPALAANANGEIGLVVRQYSQSDLDAMSGGMNMVDMDGDCVPDMTDPDPWNYNIPVMGGQCMSAGFRDADNDCVDDNMDPDDTDPNVPVNGGECDADGDCTPDQMDPMPHDPNSPIWGGNCGYQDLDGDCVEDKEDPNPHDPTLPYADGACAGYTDYDGDCIPSHEDPDPNNFDIPTPGGQCNVQDADADCVPDNKDPDPGNMDVPFMGGDCGGYSDMDGDCVDDAWDPNTSDFNIPTPGGECDEGPPPPYLGSASNLFNDLQGQGTLPWLGVTTRTDSVAIIYVLREDVDAITNPRHEPPLYNAKISFSQVYPGMGGEVRVDVVHVDGAETRTVILTLAAEDEDPMHMGEPLVEGGALVFLESSIYQGFGGDADGDCVPDDTDTDPANKDIPTPGGQCGGSGGGDMDMDCVPDMEDDDPMNPDIPTPGGECGPIGGDPSLYNGPLLTVTNALRTANDEVKIAKAPEGQDVKDVGTWGNPVKNADGLVSITDPADGIVYIFLGESDNSMLLMRGNSGRPMVIPEHEIGGEPPMPYLGTVAGLEAYLTNSGLIDVTAPVQVMYVLAEDMTGPDPMVTQTSINFADLQEVNGEVHVIINDGTADREFTLVEQEPAVPMVDEGALICIESVFYDNMAPPAN